MPNPCNSGSKVYMFLMKGTIIFIIRCEPVFKQGPSYSFQIRQLPSRTLTAESHLLKRKTILHSPSFWGSRCSRSRKWRNCHFLIPSTSRKTPEPEVRYETYTPEDERLEPKNHPFWKGKASEPNHPFSGLSRESSRVYLKNHQTSRGYDLGTHGPAKGIHSLDPDTSLGFLPRKTWGFVAFKMGTVFLGASRQLDAHTTYISYLDLPVWVHLQKKCFRAKKVSIHHPQKGCFRWYPDSSAGMYWLNHDTNIKEGTVDWRNPANQLIGSLSSHDLQILQGFIHSKWCIFFPATVPLETMFNSCNLFFLWRCMSLLRRGIGRNNLHSIELADRLMIIWTAYGWYSLGELVMTNICFF